MPKLTLIPTKAAVDRKLAGFQQGKPLSLNFSKGETIDIVMHRFNEYRSPDNQIETLFTSANRPIPFATVLGSEDAQAYVS